MAKHLFQIDWRVICGEDEFLERNWRVFDSLDEAVAYGEAHEPECNQGLSREEVALEHGYYYKLSLVETVRFVDGCEIVLRERST